VARRGFSAYVAVLALLAVGLVVGYLVFRAGGSALQSYRLKGQEQQTQREIADLERQHEELVALREYLRSDEYVEGIARRVLGLVKPGETLTIVSGPEQPGAGGEATGSDRPSQPWWEALFGP
jgi:cell division protein FtsB